MNTETQVAEVAQVPELKTLAQAIARIVELETRIVALETANVAKPKTEGREMTDEDARRITYGELASVKHKDASEKTGLSYGQVYSCRLEFTFKHIHKEMREKGTKNIWTK